MPQLDGMGGKSFLQHIGGNETFQGIQYGIDHPFADKIFFYQDGNAALGRWVELKRQDMAPLFLCKRLEVKFGNDGISSVAVYDFNQRLNTSGLVDVIADVFVLAEVHTTVGHAVSFFQYPHLFRRQGTVGEAVLDLVALFGKVGHELFGVDRYFQNAGIWFLRGGAEGHVQVAVLEFLQQCFFLSFIDEEADMGIGFPEMVNEVGHEVGGNRGQYTDAQAAVHAVCFIGHHFFDALGFIQGYLCLPDNLFSEAGGGDILSVAVENLDIKLFFQLLNHCTEGRLCHPAGFGGKYEVAVFVEGHNVFHLL